MTVVADQPEEFAEATQPLVEEGNAGSIQLIPPAALQGRFTYLRPVVSADYEYLFRISTSAENLIGWRYRGAPPAPDRFVATIWASVLVQFLICERQAGNPCGLVTAYGADHRNGVASLALILDPDYATSGWAMEGAVLFLDHLFRCWPIRKLYLEVLEPNLANMTSGLGKVFEVEGQLRSHEYVDGSYVDKYVLAIYREGWGDAAAPYQPR